MRILVTGGAGFIGSHLVQRLVERGEDVVVFDSLEEQVHLGAWPLLPAGVRFIHAAVDDIPLIDEALTDVDRVVHLAAAVGVGQSMYEVARYVRTNTYATAVFLERLAARADEVDRLVVASSMSIYGEGSYECSDHGAVAPPPRPEEQLLAREWEVICPHCRLEVAPMPTAETKPLIPTSVYAITKRDHEELSLVMGAAYGIPTVALRFFNVYGPGQALSNPYTGVAAIFSSRLLNGRPPIIFEDGRQARDFIHVSDIVDAILLALDSETAVGHALNVGTGRASTVLDVAAALSAGLDMDIEPEVVGRYRAGDIRHCYSDTRRARDLLGFEAQISLEEGMRELVEWLGTQTPVDSVEVATSALAERGLTR
jgi:dTDP-L-rhamnose 4-epimerase